MTKEDYYNICGRDGDLNIPRTYRTYFDRLCHEYSCYPVKQKNVGCAHRQRVMAPVDIAIQVVLLLETLHHDLQRGEHLRLAAALFHEQPLGRTAHSAACVPHVGQTRNQQPLQRRLSDHNVTPHARYQLRVFSLGRNLTYKYKRIYSYAIHSQANSLMR